MAIKCGLAAVAALLAVSTSGVRACDDYPEEMAMAIAREAVKAAQTAAVQQPPVVRAAAPLPDQADATALASVEPRPAHPQVAEPTSALAR